MKPLSLISLLFFLLMLFPVLTNACDIIVSIEGPKKEIYKAGEVVVVKITVVLKHRNCDVNIN
jgi:hypothetical protein